MELSFYVGMLRRNWLLLTLVIVVCVSGAAAAAAVQTPMYTASSTLVATIDEVEGASVDEASQRQLATQRASTLAQFATTAPVQLAAIEAAARETRLPAHVPALISASADGASPFLTITVTDPSPQWAQAVANAYRTAMPAALSPIDPAVASAARQLTNLTPAAVPGQPSSPNWSTYLLLGLLLGVVLGVGVVLLKESLDRQITEPEDVGRALGLPVLGAVPQEDPKRALPMRSAPHSARAEAYRSVLANLPFLNSADELPQSVMITGTAAGEGVSTLSANLAVAWARSGRQVLLVDANLRDPRLHEIFDVPAVPGLSEVLAGEATLEDVTHVLDGGALRLVTAGALPDDPVERLTNARASDLFAHLGKGSDVVVFDTPPVVPVADALFLARHVSVALLTARVRLTKKDELRRAGDALFQVRAPLTGVVVNGTSGRTERLRPSRRHGEGGRPALTTGHLPAQRTVAGENSPASRPAEEG